MAQKNEKILGLLQSNLIKNLYPKRFKHKNIALLVSLVSPPSHTHHWELQVDCNTIHAVSTSQTILSFGAYIWT